MGLRTSRMTVPVTRKVAVKDGHTWRDRVITIHAQDVEQGVRLMTQNLTHNFGEHGWRFVKTAV
jgi:hypothetical protein